MSAPNDDYKPSDEGTDTQQTKSTSRTSKKDAPVPVQDDSDPVEDPIDVGTANSNEKLVRDDADAIDKSNIIEERTRGAAQDSYREPGDDEGLGDGSDGRRRVAGGVNYGRTRSD